MKKLLPVLITSLLIISSFLTGCSSTSETLEINRNNSEKIKAAPVIYISPPEMTFKIPDKWITDKPHGRVLEKDEPLSKEKWKEYVDNGLLSVQNSIMNSLGKRAVLLPSSARPKSGIHVQVKIYNIERKFWHFLLHKFDGDFVYGEVIVYDVDAKSNILSAKIKSEGRKRGYTTPGFFEYRIKTAFDIFGKAAAELLKTGKI
jgi:hypothetical protein